VEKVRSELPVGFSEKVADKILGGLLDTAAALELMPPA
jgi:serine/threonine-protein kinase HipA